MHKRALSVVVAAGFAILLIAASARAEIRTGTVAYKSGHVEAHSYLAYDDARGGRRPGILVVPEWWGLVDYPKMRARMLARLGYVTLAVDVYGDGKTAATSDQAAALSRALEQGDRGELRARLAAALAELRHNPRVDPDRVAAIGYCFGGLSVLELARSGADLKGVVSFHGPLDASTPARRGQVKAQILVCTGADDPYVPPAKVQAFEQEMRNAGADFEINIYSGAKHSFTNPAADQWHSPALAYNREADHRSWQAMRDFFAEIFER